MSELNDMIDDHDNSDDPSPYEVDGILSNTDKINTKSSEGEQVNNDTENSKINKHRHHHHHHHHHHHECELKVESYDDSWKSFILKNGKNTTALEVVKNMSDALCLEPSSLSLFSIWAVGDQLALQLKYNHEPLRILKQWKSLLKKFTFKVEDYGCSFVFRRDAFVSTSVERKVRDPIALYLLFHEARHNVLESLYPCTVADICYLSGILMQLNFGDHNPVTHVIGFLTEGLEEYVPFLSFKKMKPHAWEALILEAHKQFKGKEKTILHLLYLQYVWQFPFYGSVFFYGMMEAPHDGPIMREFDDIHVRIGLTAEHIHIFNDRTNMSHQHIIHSFLYDDICWDSKVTGAFKVFFIEYGPISEPNSIAIMSPQASLMDTFVSRAVDRLNEKDEDLELKRLEQQGDREAPRHKIETDLQHVNRKRKNTFSMSTLTNVFYGTNLKDGKDDALLKSGEQESSTNEKQSKLPIGKKQQRKKSFSVNFGSKALQK